VSEFWWSGQPFKWASPRGSRLRTSRPHSLTFSSRTSCLSMEGGDVMVGAQQDARWLGPQERHVCGRVAQQPF
jgi:hypothetical protein